MTYEEWESRTIAGIKARGRNGWRKRQCFKLAMMELSIQMMAEKLDAKRRAIKEIKEEIAGLDVPDEEFREQFKKALDSDNWSK